MLELFHQRFHNPDSLFLTSDKNRLLTSLSAPILHLPDVRTVATLQANSEDLQYFPSCTFDVYLASMSLMLVDHPELMIKESYRVLKPKGKAGFTIWGRKDKCPLYFLLYKALQKIILFKESSGNLLTNIQGG